MAAPAGPDEERELPPQNEPYVLCNKQYVQSCYLHQPTMAKLNVWILRGMFSTPDGKEVSTLIPTPECFQWHNIDDDTRIIFQNTNLDGYFGLPAWGADVKRAWQLVSSFRKDTGTCQVQDLQDNVIEFALTNDLISKALNLKRSSSIMPLKLKNLTDAERAATTCKPEPKDSTFEALREPRIRRALEAFMLHLSFNFPHRFTKPKLSIAFHFTQVLQEPAADAKRDFSPYILKGIELASKQKTKKGHSLSGILALTRIAYAGIGSLEKLLPAERMNSSIRKVCTPTKRRDYVTKMQLGTAVGRSSEHENDEVYIALGRDPRTKRIRVDIPQQAEKEAPVEIYQQEEAPGGMPLPLQEEEAPGGILLMEEAPGGIAEQEEEAAGENLNRKLQELFPAEVEAPGGIIPQQEEAAPAGGTVLMGQVVPPGIFPQAPPVLVPQLEPNVVPNVCEFDLSGCLSQNVYPFVNLEGLPGIFASYPSPYIFFPQISPGLPSPCSFPPAPPGYPEELVSSTGNFSTGSDLGRFFGLLGQRKLGRSFSSPSQGNVSTFLCCPSQSVNFSPFGSLEDVPSTGQGIEKPVMGLEELPGPNAAQEESMPRSEPAVAKDRVAKRFKIPLPGARMQLLQQQAPASQQSISKATCERVEWRKIISAIDSTRRSMEQLMDKVDKVQASLEAANTSKDDMIVKLTAQLDDEARKAICSNDVNTSASVIEDFKKHMAEIQSLMERLQAAELEKQESKHQWELLHKERDAAKAEAERWKSAALEFQELWEASQKRAEDARQEADRATRQRMRTVIQSKESLSASPN